jgi:acyl-CoA synthetase (AMP-forming)/AMP-acid ligase II
MTTITGPLRAAARTAPQQAAVRCGQSQPARSQTWQRARRLPGTPGGLGRGRGDRVAAAGRNRHRYLQLDQAVQGAGMVIGPPRRTG